MEPKVMDALVAFAARMALARVETHIGEDERLRIVEDVKRIVRDTAGGLLCPDLREVACVEVGSC